MKLLVNATCALFLASACAAHGDLSPSGDGELDDFASKGEEVDFDSEEITAAPVEEPVLVVEVDNGNELHFYVSEDGGRGVVELGQNGNGSIIAQLPENATPYEVFHAVSEPGTPAPEGLLLDAAARESLSEESKMQLARPQGWLAELNQSASTLKAAPFQCDNDHSFWARFCVENPLGDTTYTQFDCVYNTTASFSRQVYASNFSGGMCRNSGASPHVLLRWRSKLPGTCGITGSWTNVWSGTASWVAYTWNGAFRDWQLTKGTGGSSDVGLKYRPANCVL